MLQTKHIGYTVLIGTVLLLGFLYYSEKQDRLKAERVFLQEKKEALRKQKEETHHVVDSLTTVLRKTNDSLRKEEQNIKYRPYEKLMYVDRDVDSALDTIAKYHFNP